jgi:hypothetical protein
VIEIDESSAPCERILTVWRSAWMVILKDAEKAGPWMFALMELPLIRPEMLPLALRVT